jgi:hypothetical protein
MSVGRKKPGNRFSVSFKDPDVASAFRDVASQFGNSATVRTLSFSKTYTPPIVVGCPALPDGVTCVRAKSRAGIEYISASGVRWKWSGGELTILDIPGLTVGQVYDINLLVVL